MMIRKRTRFHGSVQGEESAIDQVIMSIEAGTFVRIEDMEVQTINPDRGERGFRTR